MQRSKAIFLDEVDPLQSYPARFLISDPEVCYLDGNSLGRLPKDTITTIQKFLVNEWGSEVVEGWSTWVDEAETTGDLLGRSALGAAPGQTLVLDTTSVNLYQLAVASIKARPNRRTIIIDSANFPTDRYIMQGIADQFGLKLVIIDNENPDLSENELITAELLEKYLNDDVALVSLQVVNYRGGCKQDIKQLTDLVRSQGALLLWDAAHAIGSTELNFDANGVDIAVGCTYKYGNSGPGAPAWIYVNRSVQEELHVPIQGWFAQENQFEMGPDFSRTTGMRGFQIASPSLLGLRSVQVAFSMIEEAGIENIVKKCQIGTSLMIELFDEWLAPLGFTLGTPRDPERRGGHLALKHQDAEVIARAMRTEVKVIPDFRAPDVIRVAISPLTNSYEEIYEGFLRIKNLVESKSYHNVSNSDSRVR
ncbi:MAG: kynureninase [Candidatus Nanopelagicales bacterium]